MSFLVFKSWTNLSRGLLWHVDVHAHFQESAQDSGACHDDSGCENFDYMCMGFGGLATGRFRLAFGVLHVISEGPVELCRPAPGCSLSATCTRLRCWMVAGLAPERFDYNYVLMTGQWPSLFLCPVLWNPPTRLEARNREELNRGLLSAAARGISESECEVVLQFNPACSTGQQLWEIHCTANHAVKSWGQKSVQLSKW